MRLYCNECKKQTNFDKCGCEACVGHCFVCNNCYKNSKIETESLQCLIEEVNDETSESAQQELNVLINRISLTDKTSASVVKSCKHCNKTGKYQPDRRYPAIECPHLRASEYCEECNGTGFVSYQSTPGPEKPEILYDPCYCVDKSGTHPEDRLKHIVLKRRIKAVFFDCDGVLFTGRVFVHPKDGEFLKERSLIDGQGITNLRQKGYVIGFITGETSGFTEQVVNKFNDIDGLDPILFVTGVKGQGKVDAVQKIIDEHKIKWNEVAYMGDDLSDLEILKKVGYPACPAGSRLFGKTKCLYTSNRNGGDGAIRDFADHILCED